MSVERLFLLPVLSAILALAACAGLPTPAERVGNADALAAGQDWHRLVLAAGAFDLTAFVPDRHGTGEILSVYIEGDGFAWASASQPSLDPTPIHPVGLELALRDPRGNAAYLARPCQYLPAQSRNCDSDYWTDRRFAPEVVAASGVALDALKARAGARRLVLVGYSGGAAVAALLAARRGDVDALITVAGNLDHQAWTSFHQVRPLVGSLDPTAYVAQLQAVPQVHYAGERDTVVPPALLRGYAARFPAAQRPRVRVVAGQEHLCCWAEQWPALIREAIQDIDAERIPAGK